MSTRELVAWAALALALALAGIAAGSPKKEWRARWMVVEMTHYCPGPCRACGTTGVTSTGRDAHAHRGCATDPLAIPTGSHLDVPGFKPWMRADDTGGAIIGARVDVRVPTHKEAVARGRAWVRVRVWERVREGAP